MCTKRYGVVVFAARRLQKIRTLCNPQKLNNTTQQLNKQINFLLLLASISPEKLKQDVCVKLDNQPAALLSEYHCADVLVTPVRNVIVSLAVGGKTTGHTYCYEMKLD